MIRTRAAAWVFAIAPAALLLAPSPALARRPPSYHSPGYKGTTRLPRVTAKPFPPTVLGTGKYPNVLVDGAGTGHVTFSQDGGSSNPDTISYCRLLRGQKNCSSTTSSLAPVAPPGGQSDPYISNFPGGNHDFDGSVPLAIGNQLFLVDRRFPDTFPTPGACAVGEQRLPLELRQRRRQLHRAGDDRRQPDRWRGDRLWRLGQPVDRHDLAHRDGWNVLPGRSGGPVHDCQGTARHARAGL